MELDKIWLKIARQQKLTPHEEDFLQSTANDTQKRNSFFAGNVTPEGMLNIPYPFSSIYSEIFETDTSEISINIPSNFNHLFIFASGRSTAAAINSVLCMRINRDTGVNYGFQGIYGSSTSVTGEYDFTTDYAIAGGLAGTSASSGKVESSISFISNIQSPFNKIVIALLAGLETDSISSTSQKMSFWSGTEKINELTFFSSSGNILAGSIISIYGIV